MAYFSVHEFSSVRLQIIFFCSVRFYLLQFLFGITRKKNCFSFTGYSNLCFCSILQKKKKLFQFYRLLKSVFLFGITRKTIVSVLQVTKIFVYVRYYKKKKICYSFFFFPSVLYLLQVIPIFCFCFWITGNNKTAVFLVSAVFKLFEDCSFSVSIVLKYLFLYSNIFRFCTAVLHSKYLLHIYIQIFVTEMASPSTPVNSIPNHGEKPERFNGTDFERWQQKMLFYLTTLNLARFLN